MGRLWRLFREALRCSSRMLGLPPLRPSKFWEIALRRRAQDDTQDRAFTSAVERVNYDQDDDEDARGLVSDPARDAAREGRSFSRSTAKFTPQMLTRADALGRQGSSIHEG